MFFSDPYGRIWAQGDFSSPPFKRAGVGVPGSHDSITGRSTGFQWQYNADKSPDSDVVLQKTSRLQYRLYQFRRALRAAPDPVPVADLLPYLTPPQAALFLRMQPSEQEHAFHVLRCLVAEGRGDPHLLAAALLHDVGKALYPLALWERALVVLGKKFLPRLASRWGQGRPRGLSRPFAVAARHPAWGADLAAAAGATARACDLIRRHQSAPVADDPLLAALQAADDIS